MPDLVPMPQPAPYDVPQPLSGVGGGAAIKGTWFADPATGEMVFSRWGAYPAYDAPLGIETDFGAGGALASYTLVVARTDPAIGFAALPLDTPAVYFQVDPPSSPGIGPAATGKALVGVWKRSIFATTGWAHDSWQAGSYDTLPEGFQFGELEDGTQTLTLVFARTRLDGAIIPIATTQPGTPGPQPPGPPPPPPPPTPPWPPDAVPPGQWDNVPFVEVTEVLVLDPSQNANPQSDDCCNKTVAQLQKLVKAVQALDPKGGGNPNPKESECCKQVVSAIGGIVEQLTAIATELPELKPPPSGPVDLSPVVDALNSIQAATQNIADAAGKPVDLDWKPLLDKLQSISDTDIGQKDMLDRMVSDGLLTAEMGQLLGDPIRVRVDPSRTHPKVARWLVDHGVIPTAGSDDFANSWVRLLKSLWNWVETEAGDIAGKMESFAEAHGATIPELFGKLIGAIDLGATAVPDALLKFALNQATKAGEITPENSEEVGFRLYGNAFIVGQLVHLLAELAGKLFYPASSVWGANARLAVDMLGFDNITKAIHGALMPNAIGIPQDYHYRAQFRPFMPAGQHAAQLFAKRLIDESTYDTLYKYSGHKEAYKEPIRRSAYVGIQPRALSALFTDQPFPRDEVQAMLEFHGSRPEDIPVLLDAYEWNSSKNVRQQYVGALLTAAERGTIDDPTLDGHLDSLHFSAQAKNYVHLTVSIRRLEQLAEIYRKSVTALYETGQLADDQYVPALEAIGIARADAEAHYALDSARLRGKALAEAERAATREKAVELRERMAALRVAFLSGYIDVAALTASLELLGLAQTLIVGIVAHLAAELAARQVDTYGVRLTADKATLLKEKVAVTKEQVIKKLITATVARDELRSFGLPAANIEALVAAWAAQALKRVLPP